MVMSVRGVAAATFAVALLAACGAGTKEPELASVSAAHEADTCNFDTPGYWCGGASPIHEDPELCEVVGFENCTQMCECFNGANAAPFIDSAACPEYCGGRAGGMTDMLNRAWAAFQLSSMTQCENDVTGNNIIVGVVCPEVCPSSQEGICYATQVQQILDGCNRETQETLKDCIDTVLNEGGACAYPNQFTCTPRPE